MLTMDIWLDQGILHEAEALSDAGDEVIILAGWDPSLASHEIAGRIKIHRLSLTRPPAPRRRKRPPRLSTRFIRFGLGLVHRFFSEPFKKARARVAADVRCWTNRRCPLNQRSALEQLYYTEGLFYRPDILHAHDLPMLPVAAQLKDALHVPLVYDMHESFPDQPRWTKSQKRRLLRDEKGHIGAADLVITRNEALHDWEQERKQFLALYDRLLPAATVERQAAAA